MRTHLVFDRLIAWGFCLLVLVLACMTRPTLASEIEPSLDPRLPANADDPDFRAGHQPHEFRVNWAREDLRDSVEVRQCLLIAYKQLTLFRGSQQFHDLGFGIDGPFYAWGQAVAGSDLWTVANAYRQSKGEETALSKFFRGVLSMRIYGPDLEDPNTVSVIAKPAAAEDKGNFSLRISAPGASKRRMEDSPDYATYVKRLREGHTYALQLRRQHNGMRGPARGWTAVVVPPSGLPGIHGFNPGVFQSGMLRQPPIPRPSRPAVIIRDDRDDFVPSNSD